MATSLAADIYDALLVDDEPVLRQAMARAFNRAGFRCELAGDGRHALQLMSERRFHLVVTDLRMPEMNGHRLSVELLGQANRPVVMVVTGVTEQKLEADLRARGVDDIQFKPVDYGQLAERARALVEERSVRQVEPRHTEIPLTADTGIAGPPLLQPDPVGMAESTMVDSSVVTPASVPQTRVKQGVNPPGPASVYSAELATERITRLERDLARFKARQNLSGIMLAVTCIASLVLGWLLAIISAWAV
jgi:CheY-like chemotaxis protein